MAKRKGDRRVRNVPPFTAYRFTSDAHEAKVVLAWGIWGAVGLFLQWRAANDIGDAPFAVDPRWASTLTGVGRQHIHEALERCQEPSIALLYRADEGWALGGPLVTDSD